jgi:D-alanine-D-alanine ligase
MDRNLVILYGGPSSEREVSFGTKDYFVELYAEEYPLVVEWLENSNILLKDKEIDFENFLKYLKKQNSVVIIASHGEYVEDGYLQKRFENSKIRYTGSDSKACRLSMDKYETYKKVNSLTNCIPTYKTKANNFDYEEMISFIGTTFPIFVKPNNLGSSVGIYKIYSKKKLDNIRQALGEMEYLFQPEIKGKEVSLGTVRSGEGFFDLPPTEIVPADEYFSYRAKYEKYGARELTPARLTRDLSDKLKKMTNKIHDKLGLGYYSRSDFIIDENNKIYFLETNSLPGMTKTSLLLQQLEYADKLEDFKEGLLENVIIS